MQTGSEANDEPERRQQPTESPRKSLAVRAHYQRDQPERKWQPTESNQLFLPIRQGRFIPTGEESVTVTSQAEHSRGLNAGSQPVAAARANIVRHTSETRSTPTPLSQRARRFLQPLVGIDPTSIRIYRDTLAEHLTGAYQADAVTVGDDIEMAVGHPDDTPETLGLLAHEFTHVARQREPGYVPPIARVSSQPSQVGRSPLVNEMATGTLSPQEDEEALAQRVEYQVTRAAEGQADQMASLPTIPTASPVEPPASAATTRADAVPRTARDNWGGLPAPWEPLPDWLVSSSVTTGSGHATVVAPQSPQAAHGIGGVEDELSGVSGAYGGGTWNGNGPSDTGMQRAGLERSLGEEEQTTASVLQSTPDAAQTPEPDLDALAQQVYTLLKRRMGVEHRRKS